MGFHVTFVGQCLRVAGSNPSTGSPNRAQGLLRADLWGQDRILRLGGFTLRDIANCLDSVSRLFEKEVIQNSYKTYIPTPTSRFI